MIGDLITHGGMNRVDDHNDGIQLKATMGRDETGCAIRIGRKANRKMAFSNKEKGQTGKL